MSGQRLDIRKQAMELREEIEIPRVILPTRPGKVSTVSGSTAEPAVEAPTSVASTPAVNEAKRPKREAVKFDGSAGSANRFASFVTERVLDNEEFEAAAERVDRLSRDSIMMVPVNARVPKWLNDLLNETVHLTKSKGKKIKKEDIVTSALIVYLGIESESK